MSDGGDVGERAEGGSEDPRRWWTEKVVVPIVVAVIGLLALVLAALAASGAFGRASGAEPIPTTTPSAGESSSAAPQPSATVSPVAVPLGCPAPLNASGVSLVQIRVKKWCADEAPRDQAYFKLRLWVTNTGNETLDIRQNRFALIVKTNSIERWSPPTPQAERPRKVAYQNRRYWAIPANADGAYEAFPIPGVPNNYTFATHWEADRLKPGESFAPKGDRAGDLVFYAPLSQGQSFPEVVGVAYMRNAQIVVLCPIDHWGPRVSAANF